MFCASTQHSHNCLEALVQEVGCELEACAADSIALSLLLRSLENPESPCEWPDLIVLLVYADVESKALPHTVWVGVYAVLASFQVRLCNARSALSFTMANALT